MSLDWSQLFIVTVPVYISPYMIYVFMERTDHDNIQWPGTATLLIMSDCMTDHKDNVYHSTCGIQPWSWDHTSCIPTLICFTF